MKQILHRLRPAAAAATVALAAALATGAPPAAAAGLTVQSITPWMQNASPVGWSATPDRVFYNSIGANGMWNGYSANPDGSDPVCLTCTVPSFPGVGTATNRGIADVSPNGQYMLVTVERATTTGEGAISTQPGKGAANDIYLYTTDGKQAWPLTDIYQLGPGFALGSIWPRFDRTGTKLVWSSMIAPAFISGLGFWQLEVADIAWSAGVPSLANVATIAPKPNAFYEPYGFTPNDQGILFATNASSGAITSDTIDQVGLDGSGLTQLSPTAPFPNYAEFAFYTPDGSKIIFGRGYDTRARGMDYWTMNADGSNPQRLTYFNEPWSTEYLGYSITGSLVFNPSNPSQFLAAIAHDRNADTINTVEVTLNPSPTSGQLTEQFYAGQDFNQLVSTTIQDPSDGFKAPASPAPGVPATNYSIRWTGGVTIPTTGTYSFCSVAEFGDLLYLNGAEVVNGKMTYGKTECATASEVAGTTVPIRLDYWHSTGDAYSQLTWIPPGATSPQMIPSTDLAPATPPAVASSVVLSTYGVRQPQLAGQDGSSPSGSTTATDPASSGGSGSATDPGSSSSPVSDPTASPGSSGPSTPPAPGSGASGQPGSSAPAGGPSSAGSVTAAGQSSAGGSGSSVSAKPTRHRHRGTVRRRFRRRARRHAHSRSRRPSRRGHRAR